MIGNGNTPVKLTLSAEFTGQDGESIRVERTLELMLPDRGPLGLLITNMGMGDALSVIRDVAATILPNPEKDYRLVERPMGSRGQDCPDTRVAGRLDTPEGIRTAARKRSLKRMSQLAKEAGDY